MKFLGAVCLLVACSRAPASTSLAQPEPKDHEHTVHWSVSFAAFKGTDLVECDDVVASKVVYRDVDPALLRQAADELWAAFKAPDKGSTATRLNKSCGEQFPDRLPFGVCEDQPIRNDILGTVAHYSFADVFRSDWAMKECLENKGHWTSMPRQSRSFIEAQMRFDQADIQRRTRKLLRATGVDPAAAGLE